MANPLQGQVAVEIGGDRYVIKITSAVICSAEKMAGKPFGAMLVDLAAGGFTATMAIFAAAIQKDRPTLTWDQVSELVSPSEFSKLLKGINEAVNIAFKPAEGGQHENPQ